MSNGFKMADNQSRSEKAPDTQTNVTLNPAFGASRVNKSVDKKGATAIFFCM